MEYLDKLIFLCCTLIVTTTSSTVTSDIDIASYNVTIEVKNDQPSKLLSRRKRFLVFPEGSSVQLVFEQQNHGYLQVGNIVWLANTAALAWELPSDPEIFYFFKNESRIYGNRRMDSSKHIYYLDEDGKVLNKVPYKRKFIVNPAFAKRSIQGDDTPESNDQLKKIPIKEMHLKEQQRKHYEDLDDKSINFHRENRKELYGKIETFLEGTGRNGHECVLRTLCETGQTNNKQGSFLEEIFKATFTLPRGRGFDSRLKYDIAHGTTRDCSHMYPDCGMPII